MPSFVGFPENLQCLLSFPTLLASKDTERWGTSGGKLWRVFGIAVLGVVGSFGLAAPELHAATFQTLYIFGNEGGTADASAPSAGVTDVKNVLWGTTPSGGDSGIGAAYAIDASSGKEDDLVSFAGSPDGQQPEAGLIYWHNRLYGTSAYGGKSVSGLSCSNVGCGTIFEIDPNTGKKTILYEFASSSAHDGIDPSAQLTVYNNLLYGVTPVGGENDAGTVFSFDLKTHSETILYSFKAGTQGFFPAGALTLYNGFFYGALSLGGPSDAGVIFKFDPASHDVTNIHLFSGTTDGAGPVGGLVVANDLLYGVTATGGAKNDGVIFSIDPGSLSFTMMHSFKGHPDGANPAYGLLYHGKKLYGTTASGGLVNQASGKAGGGTVYSINPMTHAVRILHAFNAETEGWGPECALTFGNGLLYGTTLDYTAFIGGTVFSLPP